MKRQLTKLSELQATLLLSGIVSIILLGFSAIGFAYNQPGWMIGVACGGVVSLLSIVLTNFASVATLKESKAGLYILSYFLRMILFVGIFATLVILQYKLNISALKNAFWGMAIGFLPTTLITIVIQLKYKGGDNGQVH